MIVYRSSDLNLLNLITLNLFVEQILVMINLYTWIKLLVATRDILASRAGFFIYSIIHYSCNYYIYLEVLPLDNVELEYETVRPDGLGRLINNSFI